jgi:hypothetical protein
MSKGRIPANSKMDRLHRYFVQFEQMKQSIKDEYGVTDNYLMAGLQVKEAKRKGEVR